MGCSVLIDINELVKQIEKAAPNGVAPLNSSAKIPKTHIDLIASDVGAIATGGTAGTANQLTTPRTITTTGDATYSVSFDGSANVSSNLVLANSGVTAGTYNALSTQVRPFTVDSKGRITGVSTPIDITPPWSAITGKPSTLTGYGITDAQPLDSDLTTIASLTHTLRNAIFSDGTSWTSRAISATNDLTGTVPIGRGGTGTTTFTIGRILFGGGGFGAIPTSASLFWDDTNKFLQIGLGTAAYPLDVFGAARISGQALFTNSTSSTSSTTGGAIFSGGVGIAGDLNSGGNINNLRIGTGVDNSSVRLGAIATANTSGGNWTSIGTGAGSGNTSGSNWTSVGNSAGSAIIGSSFWTTLGSAAGRYTSDGITSLTASSSSCYIGCLTKGTNSSTNENVFGFNATGNGSNTVTIGDSNITNIYLRGAITTNSTTDSTSTTSGAFVLPGGQGIGGNQHIGGFSSLGGVPSGHPAIKIKQLSGTTASSQGGFVSVAHGVNAVKILSISVLVNHTGTSYIPNAHNNSSGYYYEFSSDATNVNIFNSASNSQFILSKPFVVAIIYTI